MKVPRTFHFVFGLKPQTEPFHLSHFLCLESCLQVNQPDRILFHHHHEPYGPWWDRVRPHVELHRVEPESFVLEHQGYYAHDEGRFIQGWGLDYAHQADFVRLRALIEHGGVYADMDTLFVKPLPENYFDLSFLIGEEDLSAVPGQPTADRSLCNAFLVAQPGATFASRWLAEMFEVFDGSWSRHSCQAATELASDHPDDVTVVGPTAHYHFPCTAAGLKNLFVSNSPLPNELLSIHLWAHVWWSRLRADFTRFHAAQLTADYVRNADTTYAKAARQFLPEPNMGGAVGS